MRRYGRPATSEAIATRESDARLAQRVRLGSLEALGELYERHATDLYRTAYRVLGVATEAEDVVQDVFVGLRDALGRYEERGSFSSWLRSVVVRSALMVLRRRARSVAMDAVHLDTLPEARVEGIDAPSRIVVERAISDLRDPLRIVFLLREAEGYSHREIGALLGISAAASAIRLHRAWKELRKRLEIE